MAEVSEWGYYISELYNSLFSNTPNWVQELANIIFLIVVITIFCIFIWNIYTKISKKDIIRLNLRQYNTATHPALVKILGIVFYFVEYIIIVPFLVFFWFAAFTIFLVFLTKGLEVQVILMISTVMVVAIRATAYYREGLSKELAKLLPFTLLAVSMTEKGFFNFSEILTRLSQIPLLFGNILSYLSVIILLEIMLRFFHIIFSKFNIEDIEEEADKEEGKED